MKCRITSCSWSCRHLHQTWWFVGVVCLNNFVWHLLMASDQLVELLPPWKIAFDSEKLTLTIDAYFKNMFLLAYVGFEDEMLEIRIRSVVNKPNSMFQFCDVHHLVLGKHLSRHDYIMMWMIKTMCNFVRYETCFFIGYDNLTPLFLPVRTWHTYIWGGGENRNTNNHTRGGIIYN